MAALMTCYQYYHSGEGDMGSVILGQGQNTDLETSYPTILIECFMRRSPGLIITSGIHIVLETHHEGRDMRSRRLQENTPYPHAYQSCRDSHPTFLSRVPCKQARAEVFLDKP